MSVPTPGAAAVSAAAALAAISRVDAALQFLDGDACVIEHVSLRNPDGPDVRLDHCPCGRGLDGDEATELGGGQYISSKRHTLADVVREALDALASQ